MLQNEIKILDKIQADHEKKIMDLENDKMEEVSKNQDSRDRLL